MPTSGVAALYRDKAVVIGYRGVHVKKLKHQRKKEGKWLKNIICLLNGLI